jgi:hypothetical protein
MRILISLFLSLIPALSVAADSAHLFDDKPYVLNLENLQSLDPKPLQIDSFEPDPAKSVRIKGLRIISTGRIFPVSYEIISATESKPEVIDAISNVLDQQEGIILKEFIKCNFADKCLHYFDEVSVNDKPHHVSSHYLFLKGGTFFHFSAANYAALLMLRDSWGDPKPDPNAEREVNLLMKSTTLK